MRNIIFTVALVAAIALAPMVAVANTPDGPAPAPDFRALAFDAGAETELSAPIQMTADERAHPAWSLLAGAVAGIGAFYGLRALHNRAVDRHETASEGERNDPIFGYDMKEGHLVNRDGMTESEYAKRNGSPAGWEPGWAFDSTAPAAISIFSGVVLGGITWEITR